MNPGELKGETEKGLEMTMSSRMGSSRVQQGRKTATMKEVKAKEDVSIKCGTS
jgi:hypothetical protein